LSIGAGLNLSPISNLPFTYQCSARQAVPFKGDRTRANIMTQATNIKGYVADWSRRSPLTGPPASWQIPITGKNTGKNANIYENWR
jgi:hypothetical protein